MNKKGIIFGFVAAIIGGAAGAVGMYFYNKKNEDDYITEINDLIEENEGLRRYIDNVIDVKEEELDEDQPAEIETRDELEEQEGVKKYHHYKTESSGMGVQALFEKKENGDVTEGQKALKKDPKAMDYGDIQGLEEIDEEEFLELQEQDYDAVYLDFDANQDILYWGRGTDSEAMAEAKFGLGRNALIGPAWRWFTDYIPEGESDGAFYIKNDNLKKVFEVVCHYDPEGEVVE